MPEKESENIYDSKRTVNDYDFYFNGEKIEGGGGITPTGTKNITENGTHNVYDYEYANVNVPQGITPTGTINITENDTYDVTQYASAVVNVPQGGGFDVAEIATNTAPYGDIVLPDSVTAIELYALVRKPITRVVANSALIIKDYAFYYCTSLQYAEFKGLNNYASASAFGHCSSLTTVDLGGCTQIRAGTFSDCTSLTTLVLRRSNAICSMQGVNSLSNTPFKSGGSGGHIYIPKVLYDHLGDGTSLDYKSANYWSTYDGYGTITWHAIEGSIYE